MLTKEHYEAERAHYLKQAERARMQRTIYRYMGDEGGIEYFTSELIEVHVRLLAARRRYYQPGRAAA